MNREYIERRIESLTRALEWRGLKLADKFRTDQTDRDHELVWIVDHMVWTYHRILSGGKGERVFALRGLMSAALSKGKLGCLPSGISDEWAHFQTTVEDFVTGRGEV